MAAGMTVDSLGNLYILGSEQTGPLEFEMTVLKYNSAGTQQWVMHYDSTGYIDGAGAIAVRGNQLTITGFSGTSFGNWHFVTLTANATTGAITGTALSPNANGSLDVLYGITQDGEGNQFILGSTITSPGNEDLKLIKYDTALNEVWVRVWGSPDSLIDRPRRVLVDNENRIIVTGYANKPNGGSDMVTLRYHRVTGALMWERRLSAPNPAHNAYSEDAIATTPGMPGLLYITGSVYNGTDYDYITASYDNAGNLRWLKNFNDTTASNDKALDIQFVSGGVQVNGVSTVGVTNRYVSVKYEEASDYKPNVDTPNTAYAFYENRGQIMINDSTAADSIFYYTNAGNPQLYIGDKRLSYVLAQVDSLDSISTGYRIDYRLSSSVGSYTGNKIYPDVKTNDFLNYYLGNLAGPITKVEGYNRLVQKDVYRKIDWQLYSSRQGIKSYFVVAPGGNPSQIGFTYTGADSTTLDSTSTKLTMHTAIGSLQFDSLIAYNINGSGNRTYVSINYNPFGVDEYGFTLSTYDSTQYLVIEDRYWKDGPRHLDQPEWSTYFGGTGDEGGTGVMTDNEGNVYFCGYTSSNKQSFPLLGAYQDILGGSYDAYISKFGSAHGATLGVVLDADRQVWTSYFGGALDDKALAIYVTGNGQSGTLFVTGYTESSDFVPLNDLGEYQQNTLFGESDAFIIGVDNRTGGNSSHWRTYFGGNGNETGKTIAVDDNDQIYIAGSTTTTQYSIDDCDIPSDNGFPKCTTASSYNNNATYGGGISDGFIAKFSSSRTLLWSTFYGGSGDDCVNDIAIGDNNALVIVGKTSSPSWYPSTSSLGAYNQTVIGGGYDGFVAQFSNSGVQNWSTYYGGSGDDEINSVAINETNNIYIGGTTSSSTPACSTCLCTVPPTGEFPLCKTGISFLQHDPAAPNVGEFGGGETDGFVAYFDTDYSLLWGTYYGGNGHDEIHGLATNMDGHLFFVGLTGSIIEDYNDPNRFNIRQPTAMYYSQDYLGGTEDGLVGSFNAEHEQKWSTYYGGSSVDKINSITAYHTAIDNQFWYITGRTESDNFHFFPSFLGACCPNGYSQMPTDINSIAEAFMVRFSANDHYMADVQPVNYLSSEISIFPNPTTGNIKIQFTLNGPESVSLKVLSITGQLLQNVNLGLQAGIVEHEMYFGQWPAGVYLLQIVTEENLITKRVVKAH